MSEINIEVPVIESAARQFHDVHNSLVDVLAGLTPLMTDTGGMAGGDTQGIDFGHGYDKNAKEILRASTLVVNACAAQHEMLTTFANNHIRADSSSSVHGDSEPAVPKWVLLDIATPELPSAVKNTADEPTWWHYILSHVEGVMWPNGDEAKLRRTADLWKSASQKIASLQESIDPNILLTQKGEGIEEASGWSRQLRNALDALADVYEDLSGSCYNYADNVQQAHDAIKNVIKDLLKWTIIIEGGAGILAVVTAGISEGVGNLAESGLLARTGRAVATILRTFTMSFGAVEVRLARITGKSLKIARTATPLAVARSTEVVTEEASHATASVAQAPDLTKTLHRPYLRKSTKTAIEKAARKKVIDGRTYFQSGHDPDVLIPVDKGEYPPSITKLPNDGHYYIDTEKGVKYEMNHQWDYGHTPDYQMRDLMRQAQEEGMSQAEFNDYVNNPEHFWIQDRYSNRAHLTDK